MKLLKLYEAILNYAGIKVEKDGETIIVLEGHQEPALVEGKKLVFPYEEVLKRSGQDEIVFHPFHEFVNRGESSVVRKLRSVINTRINLATLMMMDKLLSILESPAIQKNLDPQQRDLIKSVSGTKKGSHAESAIRTKLATIAGRDYVEKTDSFFCQVYLKKNGTFQGTKHSRVGIVTFPFVEYINEVSGLTKDERQILKELFAFMFPGCEENDESYNGYSDSTVCPWLDCLMKSSYNVVSRLNDLAVIYQDYLVDSDTGTISKTLIFSNDWVDEMDDLGKYQREILLIPTQSGNEGSNEPTETRPTTITGSVAAAAMENQRVTPAPAAPSQTYVNPGERFARPINQPQQQQQVPVAAAAPHTPDGKLDLGAMLGGGGVMQQQAPMLPSYPMQTMPALGLISVPQPMNQQQAWQMQQLAMQNPAMYSAMMAQQQTHMPTGYASQPMGMMPGGMGGAWGRSNLMSV